MNIYDAFQQALREEYNKGVTQEELGKRAAATLRPDLDLPPLLPMSEAAVRIRSLALELELDIVLSLRC